MTKGKRIAGQLRWFLLVLWILCLVGGICWLLWLLTYDKTEYEYMGLVGTPALAFLGPLLEIFEGKGGYLFVVLIYLGFFFFTQWLFLRPRYVWKVKQAQVSRPMKRAAIGAAFAVTLLSVGLIYSVLDLLGVGFSETSNSVFSDNSVRYSTGELTGIPRLLFYMIPLTLWCFWGVIFCIYWSKSDYNTWLGRVVRGLIAGSVMEFFVAIPIYAKSQEGCYCERGSYAGLVFGGTVLLWAFGPGVFILFLKEKHRREILSNGSSAKRSEQSRVG